MSEKISIIAPIYNERENLEPFIAAVTGVLDSTGEDYEILLIDDGRPF
jgi:glycosyltransferase involved in cell wall biosynthesis